MRKLKHYWILIVFIIVILIGVVIKFVSADQMLNLSDWMDILDTSSAIALAILAFVGYYQFSKEQRKQDKYKKELENARNTSGFHGAVLIKFGGNPNIINDMKKYAKGKLNIPDELIISKEFGDSKGKVDKNDVPELESFLEEEVKMKLANVDKVHLFYASVGIGAYICADILNNWKSICVYHYEDDYSIWYIDKKHRPKEEKTIKDI